MRINISPAFVLIWTAVYFFDQRGMFLPIIISMVVHELCHLLALNLVKCKVDAMNFRVFGLEIVCNDSVMSYPEEFICAAAGPAGSLALAVFAARFGDYVLAGINISLFLFNILPVKPLDGGKMLYAITAWITDNEKAERLVFITTLGVIIALCIAAVRFRQWIFVYFALVACKIGKSGVKFQVKR